MSKLVKDLKNWKLEKENLEYKVTNKRTNCVIGVSRESDLILVPKTFHRYIEFNDSQMSNFDVVTNELERLNKKFDKGSGIPVIWNNTKSSLGSFRKNRSKGMHFTFSKAYLDIIGKEEILELVRHEYAHYIDYTRRGKSDHSQAWRDVCKETGSTGERCYYGRSPESRFIYSCPCCDRKFRKNRRVQKGAYCGACRNSSRPLKLESDTEGKYAPKKGRIN